MVRSPSVLCPIDFSDASRGALRYATAIAAYFAAPLTVLTVNDPLLTEAAELIGATQLSEDLRKELHRFYERTVADRPFHPADVRFEVAIGKPAHEILRVARDGAVELIVMSTHGLQGVRKLFFGSTTERVLRETHVPILLTPPADPGPTHLEHVKELVRRILVPVDLTAASAQQVQAAHEIAEKIGVPLLIAHVVEPVRFVVSGLAYLPNVDAERRARAEKALTDLVSAIPAHLHSEALVAYGDPAEEIAKIARDRHVGLVVLGLHASPLLGPHMGSVTYRVVCLTPTLVLALPPGVQTALGRREQVQAAAAQIANAPHAPGA